MSPTKKSAGQRRPVRTNPHLERIERIDRARSLREQIYGILRRLILTCEFAPGDAIDEKAIALELGVSRTPVREAVKKLSDENLVEVKAQAATAVAPIDRKLIREAFLIRRALEIESVGLAAARMDDVHKERLEEIQLLHRRAIENMRYVDAIAYDDTFHKYICEISDLPRLWHAIEVSKAHLDRCRHLTVPHPGQGQATLLQHRQIIDALAERNERLSRDMMSAHLNSAFQGILALLETKVAEMTNA
jgi:DNA-binding GntR family transcriptional regulator